MDKSNTESEFLPYTYCWKIGDWSNDGHGKTDTIVFQTDLEIKKIQKAYLKTCKLIGWSLHENGEKSLCVDYEDNVFPKEFLHILDKNGYDLTVIFDFFYENPKYKPGSSYEITDSCSVDVTEFVSVLMWYIKFSEPEFKYRILNETYTCVNTSMGINSYMGYGLYYD